MDKKEIEILYLEKCKKIETRKRKIRSIKRIDKRTTPADVCVE